MVVKSTSTDLANYNLYRSYCLFSESVQVKNEAYGNAMQTIQTLSHLPGTRSSSCPNVLFPGVCRALNLRRNQHLQVLCAEGLVWITQEGCQDDVVLAAGQFLDLDGPGRVVLSALAPAVVEFGFPQAGGPP